MARLLEFTETGIYCEAGDFYIDPKRSVARAVITHAHSDHARPGHKAYLAEKVTGAILKHFYGQINLQSLEYGEVLNLNGVKLSLHPAGHVPGSAQVRLEYQGEVWVVSGDYKLEFDNVAAEFTPVICDYFITEATFALPQYSWQPQTEVFSDLNSWWQANQAAGKVSVLLGYTLGKSQRLLKNVDALGKIFVDERIAQLNQVLTGSGVSLPATEIISTTADLNWQKLAGNLIITSPFSALSNALKGKSQVKIAHCSGWMSSGSEMYWLRDIDKGIALSDHADWAGLNSAVEATTAENIFVMHGFTKEFAHYLNQKGFHAEAVFTKPYIGRSKKKQLNVDPNQQLNLI